jgi:folate-dependent phosphoribosylglycinamide formyltransferase PurN
MNIAVFASHNGSDLQAIIGVSVSGVTSVEIGCSTV